MEKLKFSIFIPLILSLVACSVEDKLALDCKGVKHLYGSLAGRPFESKEDVSEVYYFKNGKLENGAIACEKWTPDEMVCGYRTESGGYRNIFKLRVDRNAGRLYRSWEMSGPNSYSMDEFEGSCVKLEKHKF